MLRPAIAHPCPTAQQPGKTAERQNGRMAEEAKSTEHIEAKIPLRTDSVRDCLETDYH